MMKSVKPSGALQPHQLSDGQQVTMLTTECACGAELRQGGPGTTCKRCGGAILTPAGP
jgi:hypothetical protein